MGSFFTKRKFLALTAMLSMTTMVVGATFSWTSMNNQKVNEWRGGNSSSTGPGGSLHDDHNNSSGNDANKDVYVENWGDVPIVCRVKLSEYMETGANAGNMTTDSAGSLIRQAGNASTPLLANTVGSNGAVIWSAHIPAANNVVDCGLGFHRYWEWVMGGQKYYMPASNADKAAAAANGGSVLSDNTVYTSTSSGALQTLDCSVITMADYLKLSDAVAQSSNYWIVDADGWAYWSHLIRPNTATGLLLSQVNKIAAIDKQYYYAINVQAQMSDLPSMYAMSASGVSAASASVSAPDDFTNWITGAGGTEKASADASSLLIKLYQEGIAAGDYGLNVDAAAAAGALNALTAGQ